MGWVFMGVERFGCVRIARHSCHTMHGNVDAKKITWSERGQATSVTNADALGRPRRSVLALAAITPCDNTRSPRNRDRGLADQHGDLWDRLRSCHSGSAPPVSPVNDLRQCRHMRGLFGARSLDTVFVFPADRLYMVVRRFADLAEFELVLPCTTCFGNDGVVNWSREPQEIEPWLLTNAGDDPPLRLSRSMVEQELGRTFYAPPRSPGGSRSAWHWAHLRADRDI